MGQAAIARLAAQTQREGTGRRAKPRVTEDRREQCGICDGDIIVSAGATDDAIAFAVMNHNKSLRHSTVTEEGFRQAVTDMARLLRWRVYHTRDSRGSDSGFPDLVLIRKGRIVYRELKTQHGVVTDTQQEWLEALRAAGQDAEVWRPGDWTEIEETLR